MEHKRFVFNFADVEVREREFSVIKADEVLSVEPKAFRVLLFLLRNPHKLITKDQLLDAVWNDISVSENSLTRSIALLRRVLGDDTHEPRYIATVPTIGYRFLCDVQVTEDGFARLDMDRSHPPPAIDTRHDVVGHAVGHLATEQRVTSNPPEVAVRDAVVSPDGKYLAYTDPTGLYWRQISSGETRPWGVSKDFIAHPNSWFPDSTHLLVTRLEGAFRIPSLWKLSLLGGSPLKLMDNAAAGAVSPDGFRIAYLPGPDFGSELWLMDPDGANRRRIAMAETTDKPKGSRISPVVWSPSGQRIA
jgi:DNA-binding winged helix-turn-helix (wHTH) protein/Tol biopolymer transport system component